MTVSERRPGRTGNHLLDALPARVFERLQGALTPISLEVPTVLSEPGQPIEWVHFPVDAVVSLVTPLGHGAVVEVATIGNEGIVGVPLVLGQTGVSTVRAITQVTGRAFRMPAPAFVLEVQRRDPFSDLVESYMPALFGQIAQAAGCNRLHSNEERLSRWLLMSHDRVGTDRFPITQEFLAQMLGSRRATVTVSAGILQKAGLISYQRGHMVILDREGLEDASCECYATIKDGLDSVVDRARRYGGHWEAN
jgi:CRP-like cAMP-binding protein